MSPTPAASQLELPDDLWRSFHWVDHTQILLDSYRHWVGSELIDRSGTVDEQAQALFFAPFVVVSHGVESDPVLNYGNLAALRLWQMLPATFCSTPSRLTAEPMHRDERARLLERTRREGFVDDYSGVRITSRGERFLIERATVWNLRDAAGNASGQAATFSDWKFLTDLGPNEAAAQPRSYDSPQRAQ